VSSPRLAAFHTLEFFGFDLPPLMLWASVALILFAVLRRLLERLDFYRFVWHRSLFNLAIYVLLVGGIAFLGSLAWL
jgi:hypothetical protein